MLKHNNYPEGYFLAVGNEFYRETYAVNQGRVLATTVKVVRLTKTLIITDDEGRWLKTTGEYYGRSEDRIVPITPETQARFKHDARVVEALHLIFKIDAWAHGANTFGGEGGFVDEPDLVAPVLERLRDTWGKISTGPLPE